MAGFLTALGALGTVAGGAGRTEENLQNQQTQNVTEAALGKQLMALGPQYDYAKQMYQAGGPRSIPDIITTMSGPTGKAFQEQYLQDQWNKVWQGPGDMTSKLWQGVGLGILKPADAIAYQRELTKKQPLTTEQQLVALQNFRDKAPKELQPMIDAAIQSGDPGSVEAAYKELTPAFGAGLYGMRYPTYTFTDPEGNTYSMPLGVPARGTVAHPLTMGGGGGSAVTPPGFPATSAGGGAGAPAPKPGDAGAPAGFPAPGAPPPAGATLGTGDPSIPVTHGGTAPAAAAPSTGIPGMPKPGEPLIGRKMEAGEKGVYRTIATIIPQLQDLRIRIQSIDPEKWDRSFAQRQIDYFKAQHGILPSDPQLGPAMDQIIQVENNAKAALLASAHTRAWTAIKESRGHIPTGASDWHSIMTNIDMLLQPNGPYFTYLRSLNMAPTSMAPATATTAPATRRRPGTPKPGDKGYDLRDGGKLKWVD